jgi:4-amino-4-deoxy-L-arabinose transferase-like glycosyltransferase
VTPRPLGIRRPVLWALVAVTGLAAALRVAGLRGQGFLFWDEASFLNEARYWLSGARDLEAFVSGSASGSSPFYGRPTHVIVQAVALAVFGDHAWAGQLVSVAFGVAAVPLVFQLGRLMFGEAAGLAAAIVLALCPLHVLYSRTALSVIDASTTFYLAVYLWWRARGPDGGSLGRGFAAGLTFGVAGTMHYPLWPLTGVPPALELALGLGMPGGRARVRSLAMAVLLLAGAAMPGLAWQGVFLGLQEYASSAGLRWALTDYFGQLTHLTKNLTGVEPAAFRLFDPGFYVYALAAINPGLVLVIALGLAACVARWIRGSGAHLVVLALVVCAFLVFTVAHGKGLRQIAIVLPAAALLGGIAWAEALAILRDGPPRRAWRARLGGAALAGVALLVVADEVRAVRPFVATTSSFEAAVRSVTSRSPAPRLWSTQPSITGFLAGGGALVRLAPGHGGQLHADYQDGYRYVLLDQQPSIHGFNRHFLDELARGARPVFSAPDTFKTSPVYVLEQDPTGLSFRDRMTLFARLGERGSPRVSVYEIPPELAAALGPRGPSIADVVVTADSAQLLTDPGLERLSHRPVEGWHVHGKGEIDASGTKSHSGRHTACTGRYGQGVYTQTVPVTAGQWYVLGEWVRASREADQSARLQINWTTAAGTATAVTLSVVPVIPAWRRHTLLVRAPAGTERATIFLQAHAGGDVCFDDVTLSVAIIPSFP